MFKKIQYMYCFRCNQNRKLNVFFIIDNFFMCNSILSIKARYSGKTSVGSFVLIAMADAESSKITSRLSIGTGRNYSILTFDNLNPCIKVMEYAVRGPLAERALELDKELKQGKNKPFVEVIKANLGDCHAVGQPPITFIRQVLATVCYPQLMKCYLFPEDVKARAKLLLSECRGGSVGSYSESPGIELIRRHVAEYIAKRDGFPCNWEDVIMCAGASTGITGLLKLLINPMDELKSGIMVPIPQYPLYSATIAEYNLHKIGYYIDESTGWSLTIKELKEAIEEAKKECHPRALVVINPGNPTGQVLTKKNIEEIIKFAFDEDLFLFADEVYQHNIYDKKSKFHSFKKVSMEMGSPYSEMELASFMSCSKGYMGECGLRGGYAEIINLDPIVKSMFLKALSARLCPTVIGQVAMDCVVKPPEPGDPSYDLFTKEKDSILASLAKKAKLVADTLNSIDGISCNVVQGAMYAFPQIHLSSKAVEIAKSKMMSPDAYYAFELLESTGICVVPGSGFGQKEGTHHIRTTILPPTEKIIEMMEKFKKFHNEFMLKHQ